MLGRQEEAFAGVAKPCTGHLESGYYLVQGQSVHHSSVSHGYIQARTPFTSVIRVLKS